MIIYIFCLLKKVIKGKDIHKTNKKIKWLPIGGGMEVRRRDQDENKASLNVCTSEFRVLILEPQNIFI